MATRILAALALALFLGAGVLAMKAEAYTNCTTNCYGYGNSRTCYTNCY